MRRAIAAGGVTLALALAAMFGRPGVLRAPHPAPSISLHECDGLTEAQCGTLDVFEDRRGTTGRKISINVVVLRALGGRTGEPVFWLEGGPGAAATDSIGPVSQQYLRGFRDHHDLVFVDQRGTGKSHPLNCGDIGDSPADVDAYFGRLFPLDMVRACRLALERIADLRHYTTAFAMDDLDDVRRALGYERINLAGASYGSIAAQAYMRQHPDRVHAAFLAGVATPAFKLPLPFARAAQHAWDGVAADCSADAACQAAFPKLQDEFRALLARFDAGRFQVQVTDPSTQQPRAVTLEREAFVERLRLMLYTTNGARIVPLVVHQAFLGDYGTFQAMAARYRPGGGSTSRGMYFSVTCSETIPFITDEEIVAETRGTFLGDRRTRAHIAACGEWARGDVDRSFVAPVKSDVPAILFSGDVDGATPPWIAEQAISGFPKGRLIKAPNIGHQIPPCAWDLMQAFFSKPVARDLEASCVNNLRRPPFAIVRDDL